MARLFKDITEIIGHTPLVRLNRMTQDVDAEVYAKLEFCNPLSSIKDRIGYNMLAVAERAGKVACQFPNLPLLQYLGGWNFNEKKDLWWALVFQAALTNRHPLLNTTKWIWRTAKSQMIMLPYDKDQLRHLSKERFGVIVPDAWLERLPDAWTAMIEDLASASADTTELLLDELEAGQAKGHEETIPEEKRLS